ncbi:MAG TPA: DNA primase, partial [Micropepsaceae bacterium]|nr:DNA primase [Micropepsaceae bacterium]
SFPEAVQKLAGEAGIELPAWSAEDELRETRKKSLYEIIALAATFFEDHLRARAGDAARLYLQSRGLEQDVWQRYHLGYAPDSNAALKDHLAAKGVALDDMVEAGLVRPAEDNRAARDFFYDRVMFPIADVRGRIIAFGGRGLMPDAKPKYINTGETTLFSKGRLLYNFQTARDAVFKGATLIIAEGYMDVIALVEAGFPGAVAPLGTALTEDQLQMLWKVSPEPILCFDGDEAGLRAAKRGSLLALPHLLPGQSLRFVFLPKGEDPDSFLRSQGAEPMRGLLAKAQSLSDMLWAGETEDRDFSTPERRAGLEAELDRIVKAIRDPKIADYYRRDFTERVFKAFKQRKGFAEKPRRREEQRSSFRPNRGERGFQPPQDNVSAAVKRSLHVVNALSAAKNLNERRLLGLLICSPHLIERYSEALAWLGLDDPQLDRIRRELLNLASSGKSLDKSAVQDHLVRQGLGLLAERLQTHSVLQSDLKGQADEDAREVLWLRTRAQLADPDSSGIGEIKTRRDLALQRYLDGGLNEDWNELQRLNGEIRASQEADGKRDGK